ncbi:hypothetical protein OIU76_008686 [Salix suchowensis]|nr:hypothetical protein OIU76_008686 [Salix suchowensis]
MSLKDRAQWLSFTVNELPHSIRDDNIIQTLKLSYNALPSYMKHCFANCSLFPKGRSIDVKSLIWLWIAQGLISSSNSGDIDLYDKMLQSLQPNSSLQQLGVEGYGGMRFPRWLLDLPNLVKIRLVGCTRLEHIPPLDGIPYLEELEIRNCPSLEGWWKKSRGEMKDDSDESTVEEELIMLCFPRLSSLAIFSCPNLISMPLFPTLNENLWLQTSNSMPLQQTMKMKPLVYSSSSCSSSFIRPLSNLKKLIIWSIDDTGSLLEVGLQNLSSLQQLEIRYCSRLESLPLHGQGMPSLQQLTIYECPRLKSLSVSKFQGMIPYLPSLQELEIDGCSEKLSRGWGKKSREVWPNIKHIPNIIINRYYYQMEGRYVKDGVLEHSYILV